MANDLKRLRAYCDGILADNDTLRKEIKRLRAERDEARRSFCECLASGACDSRLGDWFDDDGRHLLARDAAKERGWDCFEKNEEATDGTDPR